MRARCNTQDTRRLWLVAPLCATSALWIKNKLEGDMRQASQLIKKLKDDEKGAALVEYTVLLGVMLVAVISTIMLVGGWVNTKWAALWTALQGN
jgi:pilus assembly protein Flp/PilA